MFLPPPHGRVDAARTLGMIAAHDVEHAMHDQTHRLLAGGHTVTLRVRPSDGRRDVDVTDERSPAPGPVERERDDVGRTIDAQVRLD